MRARGGRGGARGRVGLELESGSVGEEDGPDERGPLGSDTGRGERALGRLGPRNGANGLAGRKGWGAGWAKTKENGPRKRRKEEKGKVGRAERGLGERKKFSIFQNDSNSFKLNSNSKI